MGFGGKAWDARRIKIGALLRRIVAVVAVCLVAVLALRIWETERGPPLQPWHLVVPAELDAERLDRADWAGWMAAEQAVFETVRRDVTGRLAPEDQVASNRYAADSPLNPSRLARDWNRSFLILPDRQPVGAVVLLHGMTDAPYSLRHIALAYRQRGFVAIGLRLPAHGTVPAALGQVEWEDWLAATRLAMREAQARVGSHLPIHLVGYSNGGALALKHALDALEDARLPRAERIILISPMIGVTSFARFAGLAALPALLPAFAKASWLERLPEFNPFKYNSFPVNAARQSWRLTSALQAQLRRLAGTGRLTALPPLLALQSVADFTVSTPALLSEVFSLLPLNGSEVVLFDLNRNAKLGPLLSPAAIRLLEPLLPAAPRAYRATVVTNAGPGQDEAVERMTAPDGLLERVTPLGLAWPREVHSLSHVALPFPVSDGLYGLDPAPEEDFGVRLGRLAPRGERGLLVVDASSLTRLTSNPFFPYLLGRITEVLPAAEAGR